ncbi:MAG: glycosyltransferase [Acidobacteria bacterium]|nr:MAG: glycosyltransferase [Acidobacteriota bacterium]
MMTVSVVIATFNRARELACCLDQLRRQTFQPGDEVVVADNGSTDGTGALLARLAPKFPVPLRVVREARPGKSHAVAAAVSGCTADILAFTDDDVVVDDRWVARVHDIMEREPIDLIGGRVLPRFAARIPAWLVLKGERGFGRLASPLALLDYGETREALGPRTAIGANLIVRRAVFAAVGGYSPALGKLRGTLLSGEDHLLCERVQAAGYRAVYDPSVVVKHLVPADRLSVGYFLRWFFWSGVTHAALDAGREKGGTGRPRLRRYHVGEAARAAVTAALSAAGGGWSHAVAALTRLAFSAGYVWSSGRGHADSGPPTRRQAEAA